MPDSEIPAQDLAQSTHKSDESMENGRTEAAHPTKPKKESDPHIAPLNSNSHASLSHWKFSSLAHDGSNESDHEDGSDGESNGGWVEESDSDNEQLSFTSFFDGNRFKTLEDVVKYDRKEHDFDLPKLLSDLKITEFLDIVKVVNFVRTLNAKGGEQAVTRVRQFKKCLPVEGKSERFLQPTLPDDGVLIQAEELVHLTVNEQREDEHSLTNPLSTVTEYDAASLPREKLIYFVDKLTTERDEAVTALAEKRDAYDQLAGQFEGHRNLMEQILDKKWGIDGFSEETREAPTSPWDDMPDSIEQVPDRDAHYYASYAHHDIHEVMLKDKVRTDAYRDFVYENKHLFAGKVVLDVGCGTGILSMFCAKVGAKRVYAVDNSAIIHKAKKITEKNGFKDIITCVHTKVENLALPEKVDIIISEWMGYGLLYEAMLDSVLVAKDRFLAKGGLMVPSHTKLFLAPFSEAEAMATYKMDWSSVYGFDMGIMLGKAFDEAYVEDLAPTSQLLAAAHPFHEIDSGKARRPTSTFAADDLHVRIAADGELTGFCIWFDAIFTANPAHKIVHVPRQHGYHTDAGAPAHSFTTGPDASPTHWRQVQLIIDYGAAPAQQVVAGDVISGSIMYKTARGNDREIDVVMDWRLTRPGSFLHHQVWHLR